jgi:hypothetical protein
MQSRDAKMKLMDAAERERADSLVAARLLTPMQMAARRKRDGALDTIRGYLAEPVDPEVKQAGIAQAREALARGRQRVQSERE